MPEVWPASLPQEWPDDLEIFEPSGSIRTQTENGPAEVRRRFTGGSMPEFCSATFVLTDAQLATLRTFYKTTLQEGSLSFEWDHPRDGSTADLRFVEKYRERLARGKNGDDVELWIVSLSLEVIPS